MCYCSSSSSSESRSPLLPQHRDDKSTSAVVGPTTTSDPPLPPSPGPDDSLPKVVYQNHKAECSPFLVVGFMSVIMLIFLGVILERLEPYSPKADVVSAFMSVSNTSSGLNGTAGRLLTANWAIAVHLDNNVHCCGESLHLNRVRASVFPADDIDGHRPLASTRRFTGLNSASTARDGGDVTFSIQFRAEGADARKRVVAATSRDNGTESTLRFKVVILVWARIQPDLFRARYYLARISCDPFWIGSSNIGINTSSSDRKKCHLHV